VEKEGSIDALNFKEDPMPQTRSQDLLCVQLGYNQFVLNINLEGLTDDDGLVEPAGGGNPINWILGHVLNARGELLGVLGGAPVMTEAEAAPYKRGGEPDLDALAALPLSALAARFHASQEGVVSGIQALEDDALAAPAPFSPVGNKDETLGTLIAGLVFHESYHLGQIGLLRRLLGKPGALR
jgi:uncharacterized damage-inducible protein DinB